jgi:hypothetical protein
MDFMGLSGKKSLALTDHCFTIRKMPAEILRPAFCPIECFNFL